MTVLRIVNRSELELGQLLLVSFFPDFVETCQFGSLHKIGHLLLSLNHLCLNYFSVWCGLLRLLFFTEQFIHFLSHESLYFNIDSGWECFLNTLAEVIHALDCDGSKHQAKNPLLDALQLVIGQTELLLHFLKLRVNKFWHDLDHVLQLTVCELHAGGLDISLIGSRFH